MTAPATPIRITRRHMLGSLAIAAGAVNLPASGTAAEPAQPKPSRSTVRDRFWIFTVHEGSNNDYLERGGVRGGSRMTPAESAFYLNVPNLILVREHERPKLPSSNDIWRAKNEFEQYATSFRPLDRVLWSVVGSGGKGGLSELSPVINLAKKYPNISGVYLDDFIIDRKKDALGRVVGRPALMPEEIKSARQRLKALGRPMDVWVTLYSHELLTKHPRAIGCEPPLKNYLDLFDVLTLWTWNSDELKTLEESLSALEAIAPKGARIALGIYIWDFHNHKPVPMDLMELQCELGLKWLKEKRIHEIIFLANTVLDVGLPSAEYAREWIAKVGGQTL